MCHKVRVGGRRLSRRRDPGAAQKRADQHGGTQPPRGGEHRERLTANQGAGRPECIISEGIAQSRVRLSQRPSRSDNLAWRTLGYGVGLKSKSRPAKTVEPVAG